MVDGCCFWVHVRLLFHVLPFPFTLNFPDPFPFSSCFFSPIPKYSTPAHQTTLPVPRTQPQHTRPPSQTPFPPFSSPAPQLNPYIHRTPLSKSPHTQNTTRPIPGPRNPHPLPPDLDRGPPNSGDLQRHLRRSPHLRVPRGASVRGLLVG